MESKHLEFKIKEEKPKTKIYSVMSKFDGTELGIIHWHGPWRQYVFEPTSEEATIWSEDCLLDLHKFLLELKMERKQNKNAR